MFASDFRWSVFLDFRAVMAVFPPTETPSAALGNGRLGASGRVPSARGERPLSVQSTDLRGDAGQRARRVVLRTLPTGHQHTIADFRVRPPHNQHDCRYEAQNLRDDV